MKFESGDKVYYVSDVYPTHSSNPLKGSEYECIGMVAEIAGIKTIMVNWENGSNNIYCEDDLELVEKRPHQANPNSLFKRSML